MQLDEENFNSQNCTGKNNEAYNKTIKSQQNYVSARLEYII